MARIDPAGALSHAGEKPQPMAREVPSMLPFTNSSSIPELTSAPRSNLLDTDRRTSRGSDDDFQSRMLQGVSRTFALTIPQLPSDLCRVVSNAYLLCRIVDTIEDEPVLSGAEKDSFCRRFLRVLDGIVSPEPFARQLGASLSSKTAAPEHELIRNIERVVQITRDFPQAQRQALRRCVGTMAKGMAEFQLCQQSRGLRNLDDLDRYCYFVAGVVGEMLTRLFCFHSPKIAEQQDRLMPLAVAFGQGLQMTNILKDVWEDHCMGACWLPREFFPGESYALDNLANGHRRDFERGIQRLVGIAHGHLKDALTYTLLIPQQETGIRNFCLWAIGLAVLTLRKINRHLDYTAGNQVKISRLSVKGTMLASRLAARHDSFLKLLFAIATWRLPLERMSNRRSLVADEESALDRAH